MVFGSIASVGVFSPQGDATGIATVSGPTLDVSFKSQAGGLGQLAQLPILTVMVPVLATAVAGTVSAVTIDAARSQWTGLGNNPYTVTTIPGSVTVGGSVSIQSLDPAGALLSTGAVVRLKGMGFSAATSVTIDGVSVSNAQFVSPGEIDLTLGGPAELVGKRVLVRNPDGAQAVYFAPIPSVADQAPPNFASVHPLLSAQNWTSALMIFTERGGAVALQNPNSTAVDVQLQTLTAGSPLDRQTTVTIPPGALHVFPTTSVGATGFRAFAPLPMRMLGMGYPPPNSGLIIASPLPTLPPVQELTATPSMVSFNWRTGAAAPLPVTVNLMPTVHNANLSFRVTAPAPFSVTPAQGTAPTALTVSVNPIGLAAGAYAGNIVVTPEGPNAVATTIPLSLTVDSAPMLTASPAKLTFTGPGESVQQLSIGSTGNPISFAVTTSDASVPHWLDVSLPPRTTPAQLTVTVHSTNLPEGVYTGQIMIVGSNNSITVPVELNVSASNIFTFSPSSATFSLQAGSAPPPPQTILVYGPSTGAAFSVATDSGGSWLTAVPTPSGQLGAVVSVNPAGLKRGTYTGKVTLTSPASSLPMVLPVTLVLWVQEPTLTVTPSNVKFTIPLPTDPSQYVSQSLKVTSGGVPVNFSVSGMPGVFATPASIPVTVAAPAILGSPGYDLTVTSGTEKIVVPVSIITTTSAQAPPSVGSIVNAASQAPSPVSPGEILTVYGYGAGPSEVAGFTLDASGKVASGLNGAQVLFDGVAAPMIYGSASQANVIVPYEVANRGVTNITLQNGGATSRTWAVPVAPTAPAIFALAASGLGAAAVLNQDNSVNGPANPAARGSVIQIYATGEGQTSPTGVTGTVNAADAKTPLAPVKVMIGDQDAVVQYAGSAGNSIAGLFQLNAIVPQSIAPGAAIPIRISVGGALSQLGPTIAVQ
jgi:uncharacterized protein (TIGR03437 family)